MIRITTDSTADMPKELLKKYNIEVLPLVVNLGDEEFFDDGVKINQQVIFDFVKERNTLPKTAARSYLDFKEFFEKFVEQGDVVIHCGISSQLSVSYQNAIMAKNELPKGKVHVVDSKALSTGIALICIAGAKAIQNGKSVEEVVKIMNECADNNQTSFVATTLDYLYKGGRVSKFSFAVGGMLKIKPRLEVIEGKIINTGKDIGPIKPVLRKYIDYILNKYNTPRKDICFITHTFLNEEDANEIATYVKAKDIFEEIVVCPAGCVITSHCGPGTLGILYINKN